MIHKLRSPKTTKASKIVGRGRGSGKGSHTTGRGTKGQLSRSGYNVPRLNFEGGQNPLTRRIPTLRGLTSAKARKRGYKTSKIVKTPIKLSVIAKHINDGDVVNFEKLAELKLIRIRSHKDLEIKVVFDKAIDKKFTLEGVNASAKASEAIVKAGGEVK